MILMSNEIIQFVNPYVANLRNDIDTMHVIAFIRLMSVCFCFDDLEVTWGILGGLINNLGLSYC